MSQRSNQFASIWCFQKELETQLIKIENSPATLIENLTVHFPNLGNAAENILFECCVGLDDIDGAAGVGRSVVVSSFI